MFAVKRLRPLWLLLTCGILVSNWMLYQTSFGNNILPVETQAVVLGSVLDFMLFLPLSIMLYRQHFSVKTFIALAAVGGIAIRFVIPKSMLAPFALVTWSGVVIEAVIFVFELLLIGTLIWYLPKILADVKQSSLPVLFSFTDAIQRRVKKHPLIQVICSEMLMLYYALASWKTPVRDGMTMYKQSSFIAFQIMMIHAIAIETIGLHYWLHTQAPVVSIILLIFNVYSIFFFLGDLQALRLNPIYTTERTLYISLGLMKRAKIDFDNIEAIIDEPEMLQQKRSKNTAEFIVRDFEKVYPDMMLKMKTPQQVTGFMGIHKAYDYVAIKCDEPKRLKALIETYI